ncbi:MAG: aminotransferase class I/II-fold pyridoxal phosphate-dependent enzyme, partial [Candidatus Marinimicrobia bacterium]|nr:aminotransferase class I/II-fold pyridoxal phosphate-dependent enzyme [Candidatus Neomarinimicrobiota bacterium]
FNVNAMALAAGQAALDDADWLADVVARTAAGRAWLEDQFRKHGYEYVPSSANFVLVKVGAGRAVFEALQQRLVIGRPMDGYGLPAYLRVTVGTPTENEQFIRELNALRAAGVVQS